MLPRLLDKADGIFFGRWLRHPLVTASVVPSGAALARLMAHQVDRSRLGVVVELGAGTGPITAALLESGVPPERLVVVERDHIFHRHLSERFPEVLLIRDDAANLGARLTERGIDGVTHVISSLPMLAMGERQQRAVLDQAAGLIDGSGVFIQYTYGPKSPVHRRNLTEWGWHAVPVGTAWLNLPPATVWRFTKRERRAHAN
jgi:phosphatidylethanolamine/phosphatidyl-N-methylethanolamine N-methyltransferase